MELNVCDLCKPHDGRQVVGHDVLGVALAVGCVDLYRLDEVRHRVAPVLLVEALTVYPVRITSQGQGAVAEVRQERRADPRVV